jgi:hypothetical protein
MQRILQQNNKRGFPGMLGSVDCCHWKWKNCPSGWAGQFSGKAGQPTIVLEAVASYDLWIWHAFFGMPGSHNDINVMDRSPIFTELAEGTGPSVDFNVNNNNHTIPYFLADGIYPDYATLVKTITQPVGAKKKVCDKALLDYSLQRNA